MKPTTVDEPINELGREAEVTRRTIDVEPLVSGYRHASIVEQIPGLTRYVHNSVGSSDNPGAPDGIGELWIDTDEALEAAVTSPEMGAAVEYAKAFLDMDRTYALPANEATIVG